MHRYLLLRSVLASDIRTVFHVLKEVADMATDFVPGFQGEGYERLSQGWWSVGAFMSIELGEHRRREAYDVAEREPLPVCHQHRRVTMTRRQQRRVMVVGRGPTYG